MTRQSIDLAAKPGKITDEQLKVVREVVAASNQIKLEIGGVEARKHVLLHELDVVQKDMTELNAKLEEEYGNFDLDIHTGNLKYPEDEQVNS
tara:strand:- start:252 stop:527 length:276 start_codon:yes stop_codon:yes gene_type:complete